MGGRLESPNIPRGAEDKGNSTFGWVGGQLGSPNLPREAPSRGIRIGVDGQLGSSIYLVGQGIRIGLGGRLESSKL